MNGHVISYNLGQGQRTSGFLTEHQHRILQDYETENSSLPWQRTLDALNCM